MKRFLLICCLSLSFFLLHAQEDEEFFFEHISQHNGLNSFFVDHTFEDHYGYIWIISQSGLCKFDTKNFQHYQSELKNPKTLPSNKIQTYLIDQHKNLWFGLYGGLSRYDYNLDIFYNYLPKELEQSSMANSFEKILESKKGLLWLRTRNHQLWTFDPKTEQFEKKAAYIKSNKKLKVFKSDSEKNLWFLNQGNELFKIDSGTIQKQILDSNYKVFDFYFNDENLLYLLTNKGIRLVRNLNKIDKTIGLNYFPNNIVIKKIYGKNNKYNWFFSEDSIYKIENNNRIAYRYKLPKLNHITIPTVTFQDNQNRLWFTSTLNPMYYINENSKTIRQVNEFINTENGLKSNAILTVFEDHWKNIWFRNFYNGLNKLEIYKNPFQAYDFIKEENDKRGAYVVISMFEDVEENIWLGTNFYGLFKFNTKKNSFEQIKLKGTSFVSQIYQNKKGAFFLATRTGFYQFYPKQKKLTQILGHNNPTFYVEDIYEDKTDTLWVATRYGLYKFHNINQNTNYTLYRNDSENENSLSTNDIRILFEDSKQRLWIGTTSGLNVLDKKTYQFTRFNTKKNDYNSLQGNYVNGISEDRKGQIWVSTNKALHLFRQESEDFEVFTKKDGLPTNVLKGMQIDDQNTVWISTEKGLSKFNSVSKTFTNYNSRDGLHGDEFFSLSNLKLRSGELLFGGFNGFTKFDPSKINITPPPPEMLLSGFKSLNDSTVLDTFIQDKKYIQLEYYQNSFEISYTSINPFLFKENTYAYQLEGKDKNWIYTQNRSVIYSDLEPGNYVFKIKTRNNDGLWSRKQKEVKIKIKTVFWKTIYFKVGIVLILLFLFLWFLKYRYDQIKEKEKLKLKYEIENYELQMQALRAQMNPHFLFNSLNSIKHYIVKNETKKTTLYLSRFAQLIRNILQNSKNKFITLEEEIETLKLYIELEMLRFEKGFEFNLLIDKEIDPAFIEIPTMLIQPYVENAIWHGLMNKKEKGNLLLEFKNEANYLIINVIDDGIGRKKSNELKPKSNVKHKSLGMEITEKRVELAEKLFDTKIEIKVIDLENPSGTNVEIKIEIES